MKYVANYILFWIKFLFRRAFFYIGDRKRILWVKRQSCNSHFNRFNNDVKSSLVLAFLVSPNPNSRWRIFFDTSFSAKRKSVLLFGRRRVDVFICWANSDETMRKLLFFSAVSNRDTHLQDSFLRMKYWCEYGWALQ